MLEIHYVNAHALTLTYSDNYWLCSYMQKYTLSGSRCNRYFFWNRISCCELSNFALREIDRETETETETEREREREKDRENVRMGEKEESI